MSDVSLASLELGPYRHFMQKEIHEQPRALADTIEAFKMICNGEVDHIAEQAFFNVGGMDMVMENWDRIQKEG